MKKFYLLFLLSISLYSVQAQNTCEEAIAITAGTYSVDSINGTDAPLFLCAGSGFADAAEWYSYTPTIDTTVTITTDLMINSGGDTRFHVYTGTCANLICYSGDDDSGDIGNSFLSIATFDVSAGITYFIVFDDRWSAAGFDFILSEGLPEGEQPEGLFTASSIESEGNYAYTVVDMNGDLLDDVVAVSNSNININHQNPDVPGGFTSINIPTDEVENNPSWSMAAADFDRNGYVDLVYGGGSGVTFMMAADNGLSFTEYAGSEYIFSQRTNFVDINNDGHLDAFVCHDVEPNVYYLNDGEGNLEFFQGGLGDFPTGGNYGSIWIDYDNDHDIDLFIAKCRGGNSGANINELHRNNGDGTFTEVGEEVNMADPVQTWSSAWGDYDNDGDMDCLIGASSFTDGNHKLMINDGAGNFTDGTAGTGYDGFNSTNHENVTHDFDNDGYLDIYGAGHKIMYNNGDMTFTPVGVEPGNGPVGDLNNDGFLDILNGSTVYFNNGNDNNYIKIVPIGDSSNVHGIGARVEVHTEFGMQIRDIKSGDGFRYMSSLTAHFGLGQQTEIDSVIIYWPSGVVTTTLNPEINTTISVFEEWEEGSVGIQERFSNNLVIYPNPAQDVVYIDLPESAVKSLLIIYDMSGKIVFNSVLKTNSVNIKSLSAGTYLMRIESDNLIYQQTFIKK